MSSFTPDHEGIGEMLKAPFLQEEMMRRARAGMEYAVATAPFYEHDGVHYKEQFHVEPHENTDRAGADLINDDPAGFQIEFGTGHPNGERTPRHRTLGRAMDVMEHG